MPPHGVHQLYSNSDARSTWMYLLGLMMVIFAEISTSASVQVDIEPDSFSQMSKNFKSDNKAVFIVSKHNTHLTLSPNGTVSGSSKRGKYQNMTYHSVPSLAGVPIKWSQTGYNGIYIQGIATGYYVCCNTTGHAYASMEKLKECQFRETFTSDWYQTYKSVHNIGEYYLTMNKKNDVYCRKGNSSNGKIKAIVQFIAKPADEPIANIEVEPTPIEINRFRNCRRHDTHAKRKECRERLCDKHSRTTRKLKRGKNKVKSPGNRLKMRCHKKMRRKNRKHKNNRRRHHKKHPRNRKKSTVT